MHVVITGASAGIGAALAREFGRHGARLTLVARRKRALDDLAAAMGGPCHVVAADLADPEQVTGWLDGAVRAQGPVDVLVNNAGIQIVARTPEVAPEDGERLLQLNVLSAFRLTQAVLPSMLDRGRGTLVDVASLAALAPTPAMFHYSASKAALGAASESLRGELRGTGVHVVTVYPGPVKTDMADAALNRYGATHAGRLRYMPTGTPEGLATRVYQAVEHRRDRVIYPSIYAVARWFPGTTRWVMDRVSPLPSSTPR